MQQNTSGYDLRKLQSHASGPNNMRLVNLYAHADQMANFAMTKPHISTVRNYFAALQLVSLNIWPIMSEASGQEVNTLRKQYYEHYVRILSNQSEQTILNLEVMLQYCLEIHSKLVSGVSSNEFFFRSGIVQSKGLSKLDFFAENVFGSVKKGTAPSPEDMGVNSTGTIRDMFGMTETKPGKRR